MAAPAPVHTDHEQHPAGLWASLRHFSRAKQGALIAATLATAGVAVAGSYSAYLGPASMYSIAGGLIALALGICILGYLGAGLFGGVAAAYRLVRRNRPYWSRRAAREGFYSGLMLAAFGGGAALWTMWSSIKPLYFLPFAAGIMLIPTFLGIAIGTVRERGWRPGVTLLVVAALVANAALGIFLWHRSAYEPGPPGWPAPAGVRAITAQNPGLPGPYEVATLTYGSGTDRRNEFGKGAALTTPVVDVTPIRKNYTGFAGGFRRWFWGFDHTAAPINGRVWYPAKGTGPFPLVLFVHGNHNALDYSDPGYAYLGQLLASRGFIFVSVDENWLNGDWVGRATDEMGARGYMLLRHIGVWKEWNGAPGNPFYQKVDMGNIAVGGHSRGGEAAAVATVLNKAAMYPGKASVPWGDFNYPIKAVLSFSPSDHQFEPNKAPTMPRDVNYFVIYGGKDADASEFQGICQYQRVQFSGDGYFFKSALWVDNINHGALNTTWGRDHSPPADWLYNEAPLMAPETARQIVGTFSSAFLEVTLKGDRSYLPLLQNYRAGAAWLPNARYATLFADSTLGVVADYDEDSDTQSISLSPAGSASAEHLTVTELRPPLREGGWARETNAARLEWPAGSGQPRYTLTLPESLPASWRPLAGASLVFALGDGTPQTRPDEPVSLLVELEDRAGHVAAVNLARYGAPLRYTDFPVTRLGLWDAPLAKGAHGPVLESYAIAVSEFTGVDPSQLKAIRFVFHKSMAGKVYLDDIGFRWNP